MKNALPLVLLLSAHAAEPPVELGRLRHVTARTDARRSQGALLGRLLGQAAARLEAGQNPRVELEAIDRLRSLLRDDEEVAGEMERLSAAPAASGLRAVAASLSRRFQSEPPHSIIKVEREPEAGRRLAPNTPAPPVSQRLAGELDADKVVLLSPEIRAQADSLGNDPARIFAFVHNEVELEWHSGAMQNSLAVLWSRRAGAIDQCTLLVALLRAAGIPARYAFGSIRLTPAQLMEWTGTKSADAAIYFAKQALPLQASDEGITVDHVWAEAMIGADWTALDPAFKTRNFQAGMVIPRIPFRRDSFLKGVTTALAADAYLDQLREYLRANIPGATLSDLAYSGGIRQMAGDALPAGYAYTVTRVNRRVTALEPGDMHRIVVTLSAPNGTAVYFTKEVFLPEVCLNSLTISSAANGGAASPRNGTVTYRPSLYADDAVIAEGNAALVNTNLNIRVQYFPVGGEVIDNQRIIAPGQLLGIPFSAFHGARYLNYRINRLLASNYRTGDAGPVIRDILNITGIRYMQRLTETRRALTAPLQLAAVNVRALYGFTYGVPGVIADRPVMTPNQLGMDMIGTGRIPIADLNSGDANTAELRSFRQTLGLSASGLEHQTCEEIALMTSASTTKVLQVASELGIPLVEVTPANGAETIPTLEYTPAERNQLVGRLFSGSVLILVPKRPVPVGDIRFFAYVAEDALGFGLYIINGAAGGTVVDPRSGPPQRPGSSGNPLTGGRTVGDPVNVANGNMLLSIADLSLPARGFPLELTRSYNSQSSIVGPFGLGWTHSYNLSIRVATDSIELTDGTGGTHTFARSGAEFLTRLDLGWRITPDGTDYVMRNRGGFQWRFGPAGRLRAMADSNGNQTLFVYDTASGRLNTVTDANGRQITFTYDAGNRVTAVQDPAGRRLSYSYDTAGRLVSSTDAAGNRTAYAYASGSIAEQNLTSVTDAEGRVTRFVYYADDKVFKTVTPDGAEMVLFYLPYQRTTVVVDERGFATTYQYDAEGRVVRITDPENNTSDTVYDASGLPVEEIGAGGERTRLDYDARGNVTGVTSPAGDAWSFTYEPSLNRLTSSMDARGGVTRNEYDGRGNLTKQTGPSGAVTSFVYDASGNMTSATNAAGNTTSWTYDANGQLTQKRDALGNVLRAERDSAGRPVRLTNPLNQATVFDYDALGNVRKLTSALGHTSVFAYDRLSRLTDFTDASQKAWRYAYDDVGNLQSVTRPGGEPSRYEYAPLGQLWRVRNGQGAGEWEIKRNYRGQPVETRDPLGRVTREFYDGRGNLVERQHADGTSLRLTYDWKSRLTERRQSDGSVDSFAYDAAGNLVSAANANVTYLFTYDARNLLTAVEDSRFPAPLRYEYDNMGRRVRMIDPSGGVTEYTYNAVSAISSIRNPAGLTTRFTYDAAGRLSTADFANNTSAAYQWNAIGRLLSIAYSAGGTPLLQFSYRNDPVGNFSEMTDAAGAHQYTYDASNRLTSATHPEQPGEKYEYDSAGRRVSSHRDPSLSYDLADQLADANGVSFRYDPRGNLVGRGSQQLTYDGLRRLVGVAGGDASVAYQYDPFGRRIGKTVDGRTTLFLLDGHQILAEYAAGGKMSARFTYGLGIDSPLIMERDVNANGSFEAAEAFHYISDAIGSVRALSGAAGNLVEQYRYDSFGNLIQADAAAPPSAVGNPFLFAAREWDREIGLYYNRARHYDPAVGRFVQLDALWRLDEPDSLNRYSYANNNPVNFTDPTGNSPVGGGAGGGSGSGGGGGRDPQTIEYDAWIREQAAEFDRWTRNIRNRPVYVGQRRVVDREGFGRPAPEVRTTTHQTEGWAQGPPSDYDPDHWIVVPTPAQEAAAAKANAFEARRQALEAYLANERAKQTAGTLVAQPSPGTQYGTPAFQQRVQYAEAAAAAARTRESSQPGVVVAPAR